MTQRMVDWILAVVASVVGFALSWPFWRDFEYFAESRDWWWIYFTLGFLLAVYVFYIFIACTRTLFLHYRLIKTGEIQPGPAFEEPEDEGVAS